MGYNSNDLKAVEGYVSDHALPALENELGVTRTLDAYFNGWEKVKTMGTRGGTLTVEEPLRLTVSKSLTFDPTDSGSFTENYMEVKVNQERLSNYSIGDVQKATYRDVANNANASAIDEVAATMESYNCEGLANASYRFLGSPLLTTGQMQNIQELFVAISQFCSFGVASSQLYIVLPPMQGSNILQSMLQQYVTERNEKLALKGELGQLKSAACAPIILSSNFLPIHEAGTASTDSVNSSTGFTIDSISVTAGNPGTTDLTLSGFSSDGLTFVENDKIDIGVNNVSSLPLRYLTYRNYVTSQSPVQGRVTVGGTVSSGTVAVTIEPALIYDASATDPTRNLNRDIDSTNDKVRLMKTRRQALIYFGVFGKFAMVDLPSTSPFPSKIVRSPDSNIVLRAYHGHVMGYAGSQFVHDAVFGNGFSSIGIAEIPMPIVTGENS